MNAQRFLDYVQQQWEHHNVEKEREKVERVCLLLDLATMFKKSVIVMILFFVLK